MVNRRTDHRGYTWPLSNKAVRFDSTGPIVLMCLQEHRHWMQVAMSEEDAEHLKELLFDPQSRMFSDRLKIEVEFERLRRAEVVAASSPQIQVQEDIQDWTALATRFDIECRRMWFKVGHFISIGQLLLVMLLPVSYTHLTLPTICSV